MIWNIDPLFVDPSLQDFHLQEGSPVKDAGDPLFQMVWILTEFLERFQQLDYTTFND